jgi:hypothetical protein
MEEFYNLFIRREGFDPSFLNAMISSTTPYKLAEILRDTWPGLYRKPEPSYNEEKELKDEKV